MLDPLATIADLTARGVTVSADETDVVTTALDTASAVVRDAAHAPISQTTGTVALEGPDTFRLYLPGLPVTAVSAVSIDGSAVTDYTVTAGSLWRSCGWQTGFGPSTVEVTYTHGLETVPPDIIDIVCRLAAKALVTFRNNEDGTGIADKQLITERIGDWAATYTYTPTFSEMELPAYLRARLAARFGNGAKLVRSV